MCMKSVHDYLFAVHCTINLRQLVLIMEATKQGLPAILLVERIVGCVNVISTPTGICGGNTLKFLAALRYHPLQYLRYS